MGQVARRPDSRAIVDSIIDAAARMHNPGWMAYEAYKRELQRLDLSPAEYEQAVRRLADAMGL